MKVNCIVVAIVGFAATNANAASFQAPQRRAQDAAVKPNLPFESDKWVQNEVTSKWSINLAHVPEYNNCDVCASGGCDCHGGHCYCN
ncbi:hypothetical protein HDU97_008470 [Phlyctochytrium planicorne]|nr:hypothetical protein HDU97_008470 [Phlyctochytrium planicorne]